MRECQVVFFGCVRAIHEKATPEGGFELLRLGRWFQLASDSRRQSRVESDAWAHDGFELVL
jgi:hypothetical protein